MSSPEVGEGPVFWFPLDVELNEAQGVAWVSDRQTNGLIRVDLANGDRTLEGLDGLSLGTPLGLSVEPDGSVLVVDSDLDGLLRLEESATKIEALSL